MFGPSAAAIDTDLCVIGAGAAGLSVAATAGLLRVPVVLIERHRMGGDCLNTGCVPSKALIAAADIAHDARRASQFGLKIAPPVIDRARLLNHVREVIESIAPMDSAARMRALGVEVIAAEASFVDRYTLRAGDRLIRARRFVIATGAGPVIPPITGLSEIPYLTNETLFEHPDALRRLVVIGGGAVGLEMAQAHRRLGSEVTVIEAETILAREDRELANALRPVLHHEGIRLIEGASVERIKAIARGLTVDIMRDGARETLKASHVLVAAGRSPRLEGLGLREARVASTGAGITVDARLRTSNRRIYAIGDCVDGPRFTHVASYQAGIVIRNAVFRSSARVDYVSIPRVTFTDPSIATVGLDEATARAGRRGVQVFRFPVSEIDRARTIRKTDGLIKIVTDRKGRILGAGITGPDAGELIAPWVLALRQKLNIADMADVVLPYPTLSEISRRAALQSLGARLRNPWVGRIIRFLRKFG